jgi:type IV pilus assembly protein PilM
MAKNQDSALLGIDLQSNEIRVVEVRTKGGKPTITRAGHGPMPSGAMSGGTVVEPSLLAQSLKQILGTMGVHGPARAVFGIPSEGTVTTTVSVPPVPTAELPSLVRGELSMYSLLKSPGAVHSFVVLSPPTRGGEVEPTQVAVFGAEGDVVHGLTATAEQAGLQVGSLEPVQYAMFRTSVAQAGPASTGFHVMVGPVQTDVSFVWNGNVCFYRRIDVGSRAFHSQITHAVVADTKVSHDHADIITMSMSGATSLALEIRRAIEYLSREYPDFLVLEHLFLSVDQADSQGLAEALQEQTGMIVELVKAPAAYAGSPELRVMFSSPDSPRYAGAFGLAVREATIVAPSVQRIDLFVHERTHLQLEEKKRNVRGSFVIAALAALCGATGWYLFGNEAGVVEGQVKMQRDRIASMDQDALKTVAEKQKRLAQYKALRHEGLPIGVVMDYICASMLPGVGLDAIEVHADKSVSITGEAKEEPLLISTTANLQRSPVLQGVAVQSYQRAGKEKESGIKFTIAGQTVGSDRIRYSFEKENRP